MDGFHLYKKELDQMPNPEMMHFRRGAHFTFNPEVLLSKLKQVKSGQVTSFPAFSHSEGDPQEDAITVDPFLTQVVVVEGLYLFCDLDVWRDIRDLIDYRVFIEGDLDSTMEQLVQRNSECLQMSIEDTRYRVEHSDKLNALEVMQSKAFAHRVVSFQTKPQELIIIKN